MKILKWIGIIAGGFLLILSIGPAMISKDFAVVRTIETEAKPDAVFNQIVMLKNWDSWDPWSVQEPSASLPLQGTDGTVGATRSWKGDTIGAGSMAITKIEPNASIDFDLNFTEPMVANNKINFKLEPAGEKTKVIWTMSGTSDSWFGRYFNLMMDGMIGKDFEAGLSKLSAVAKDAPVPMTDPMASDSMSTDSSDKTVTPQ